MDTILTVSISSAEAFGVPELPAPASLLAPAGIASTEAFTALNLHDYQPLRPASVVTAEAFGTPNARRRDWVRSTYGISTGEAWGVPGLVVFGGDLLTPPPPPSPESDLQAYTAGQGLTAAEIAARALLTTTVTGLLDGSLLRKKSRITRLVLEYPTTLTYPRNPHHGMPRVLTEVPLLNIVNYTIQESDNMAASGLNLEAADSEHGLFAQMLRHNELVRIEERYSDDQGTTTGWFTVGTFLVDSLNPALQDGDHTISIQGRDPFKLLTFPGFEEALAADLIRIERRRLAKKVDPKTDRTKSYYVFVDGHYSQNDQQWYHTFNWASPPVPRLFEGNKYKRVSFEEGVIQLLYGTGEVIIDKEYFESSTKNGGLGKPNHLECEYARYCLPEDERRYVVTAVSADGLTVTLGSGRRVDDPPTWTSEPLYSWQRSLTVVALTGNGKNARFRVVSVNPSARTLTLDWSVGSEGVAVGDDLRVGEGNRLEHALERVLLAAGFQNSDSTRPFYMRIQRPATTGANPQLQLYVPTLEEFDFSGQRRTTFLQAIQALERIKPPFMQLYMAPDTTAIYRSVTQAEVPEYAVATEAVSASLDSNDTSIYTRVIYYVRDRDPQNLVYIGNSPRRYKTFTVFNPRLNAGTGNRSRGNFLWRGISANSYLEVWRNGEENEKALPRRQKGEGAFKYFTRQCERALFDASAKTAIAIENDDPGTSNATMFDGIAVFQVEFFEPFRLKQINMTCWPWNEGLVHTNQYWRIEHSLDGSYWEDLGDEFNFNGDGRRTLEQGDFGDVEVRFLRWHIAKASTARVNTRSGPFHSSDKYAFASMATVQVYGDDIVEGVAELGVDRFDLNSAVVAVAPGEITISHTIEPAWLLAPMFVDGRQFTPSGGSGRTLLVNFNPADYGIASGSMVGIPGGESDADFARDQERRRRLMQRTYSLPTVDEVGYYFVQQIQRHDKAYTLALYAADRAREHLAEMSREFVPVSVKTIRPDMRRGDTVLLDLQRLGFAGGVLVRELSRSWNDGIQFKATPYRDALLQTYTASTTVSTTHAPVIEEYEDEILGDEDDPD